MRAVVIVEIEKATNAGASLPHNIIGVQIDFLVLERAPETLDENVVCESAFTVHTDLYFPLKQHAGEVIGRKLRALIRIENLGATIACQRCT